MNVPSSPRSPSNLARVAGITLVVGALTQLILGASARATGDPLEMGKPIDREIGKGETHVYEVLVAQDRVVSGVVDQLGVDVMLRLIDPSGATVATIDGTNGAHGPEPWTLDGKKTPGTWRIEVSPFPESKEKGRYEARLDEIITSDERDERAAKLRYKSPRLLRLWREQRAEGAAAIDRFAKEMEGHAPLVEPVANDPRGDVLITFTRRTPLDVRYVGLIGGPTSTFSETALSRFEGTDLEVVTLRSPKDARFQYWLRAGDPPRADASQPELEAAFKTATADAWCPGRFEASSFVELPGAPAQTLAQPVAGVPMGTRIERTIHSAILGEDRRLGVYLPPGFVASGGPYPLLIVFDGDGFVRAPQVELSTPTILDNLITQKKIAPTIAVFVYQGDTRERDLAMSAPFSVFLAAELAPWARREYRAAADPAQVTLTGFSLGGLCSMYTAFHHPDVFGNALSQSGSFWFSPGAFEAASPFAVETGALMSEIVAAPKQPVRVWMEVGIFEGAGPLAGSNQLAQNRHMRDVLLAKGYRVSYHEYSGDHSYASWRGSLADGLVDLAGAPPTRP
jgi:enterochelin esterase family protein